MKTQGLGFADESKAEEFLSRVSYYRFRGYLYPYFDLSLGLNPRTFRSGSTFEKAWELYCFDEELRRLVFGILPEVEVALRTVLDSTISAVSGNGFWYLDPRWFKNKKHPEEVIYNLQNSFGRSAESYASHYHGKYYNSVAPKFKGMPPFWVICELATLGQIKAIFENLKEDALGFPSTTLPNATVLDKMAINKFGAASYRQLVNWVHVLRDVRNVCAHHSRLWNRNIMAPSGVTNLVSVPFPPINAVNAQPKTNTVYATLVILRAMCKKQGIQDGIKDRLLDLLGIFPEAASSLTAMGIPVNWRTDTVWS